MSDPTGHATRIRFSAGVISAAMAIVVAGAIAWYWRACGSFDRRCDTVVADIREERYSLWDRAMIRLGLRPRYKHGFHNDDGLANAARALAEFGPRAVPRLDALKQDPDWRVRTAAAMALEMLLENHVTVVSGPAR